MNKIFNVDKEELKVILAYLAVCIIWGSTYLVIRIGVSDLPPELFMGIRFVTAGILMMLFAKMKGLSFPDIKDTGRIAIVGLFLLTGANGLVAYAEQWVHSSVTALILAGIPLFMALLELLLPNRKSLDYKGWLGLIIGFGGVALLMLSGSETGAVDVLGGVMIVVASLLWAIGSIYSKSFTPTGSVVSQIGIQMFAGGLGQCIAGILLGEVSRWQFTPKGIGAMLYLIFIGSLVGYGSYVYMLSKWPASKAGTFAYVNPVVAILLGSVILDEAITGSKILATIVILSGVLLVQMSKYQKNNNIKIDIEG